MGTHPIFESDFDCLTVQMRSFSALVVTTQAAPPALGGVQQQVTQIQCLDQVTGLKYEPGEEWTQTRVFEEGPTTGMEGQFRCTCQDNGGITCKSLSLPCIFQNNGYEIGEKFKIEDYGESHVDYECACLGEPNGQISCKEINQGCYDVHTQKKYPLDSTFEQTRADDDLIRDCECTGDATTRLIKCALTRYCKLNGEYLEIGQKEVIETDTQTQTCTCIEAGRTSCIIEAKPIAPQQESAPEAEDHIDSQIPQDNIQLDALNYV